MIDAGSWMLEDRSWMLEDGNNNHGEHREPQRKDTENNLKLSVNGYQLSVIS